MHFIIPTIGSFQPGGNARGGRRPGRGRGVHAPEIIPGGRRTPCTPFADYTARQGGMGGSIVPALVLGGIAAAQNVAPMYSNIVKRYSNMNIVSRVDSMWKMGTHPGSVPKHGDVPIIRRDRIGAMPSNTSMRGTMLALRQSTSRSFLTSDGVEQSR